MPAEMGGYAGTEGSKGAIYRHLCKEKEGGETGIQCRGINIQCAGTILVSASKLHFEGSYSDALTLRSAKTSFYVPRFESASKPARRKKG